jgi:hypothetical protein
MKRTLVSGLLLAAVAGCTTVNPRPAGDDRFSQMRQGTVPAAAVSGVQPPAAPGRTSGPLTTATAAGQGQTPVAVQPPASAATQSAYGPPGAAGMPSATTQTASNRPPDYFPPPPPLEQVTPTSYSEVRGDATGLNATTLPPLREAPPLPTLPTPPPLPTNLTADRPAMPDMPPTTIASAPALRMVNSKRFTLNYEIKDAGAGGPPPVDLWCTQDMHSWRKFDAQPQGPHGYIVEVKDEGTYGFTLVARTGGVRPPVPGDTPQVWVTVDTTKPVVQMTGLELSLTAKVPSLIVRWSAKDKNFGPRPVTLTYAALPEGPWTLMAQNVENTGRYEWVMPTTMPHSLYVRVEAADLVGNLGVAQSPNPIHFDAAWASSATPLQELPKTPPPTRTAIEVVRPEASIVNVEVSAMPTQKE